MMDKYGELIGPETLRFVRVISAPIDLVWEYLTDSEKRGKWLASGEMELKAGGKVNFFFFHQILSPQEDTVPEKYKNMSDGHTSYGTILDLAPPHLLKFSWDNEGVVTIELKEEGDKVRLILTHEKLGTNRSTIIGGAAGWHTHLDILVDRVEDKEPKPFWITHTGFETEYNKRLP